MVFGQRFVPQALIRFVHLQDVPWLCIHSTPMFEEETSA
jgi:hypothetical protein